MEEHGRRQEVLLFAGRKESIREKFTVGARVFVVEGRPN
jgi:hypothetical protein